MKKILLLSFILFCNSHLKAQYTASSKELIVPYESRCPMLYITDTVQQYAFYKGNLTKYFTKYINWKKAEQIEGTIIVQVMVDTNGKACCYVITNNTLSSNETIQSLYLGDLISGMKRWKPAMVNDQPVNSIRGIAIYSRVKNDHEFTVGYFNLARKFKVFKPRTRVKQIFNDNAPDINFDKKEVILKKNN